MESSEKLKAAGVEVAFESGILDKDHLPAGPAADFDVAGVFMDSKVDADVINGLPNVKFIATLSTGFDHVTPSSPLLVA